MVTPCRAETPSKHPRLHDAEELLMLGCPSPMFCSIEGDVTDYASAENDDHAVIDVHRLTPTTRAAQRHLYLSLAGQAMRLLWNVEPIININDKRLHLYGNSSIVRSWMPHRKRSLNNQIPKKIGYKVQTPEINSDITNSGAKCQKKI
uniref:Uncharacterized protein n=1 Tax=Romanomermis culicivorax TaxID=13658 RepID=A0A915HYH3_ROMCU